MPTDTKTCPECAEEIKAAAIVCRYCGYRFAASRSPSHTSVADTRDSLKTEDTNTGDAQARAIAERIATIAPLMPGLFDVPLENRRLDCRDTYETVSEAIRTAIEASIPSHMRPASFEVRLAGDWVHLTPAEDAAAQVTACVTSSGSDRVEQDFQWRLAGKNNIRATVKPSGEPRIVTESGVHPWPTRRTEPFGPGQETVAQSSKPHADLLPARANYTNDVSAEPEGRGVQVAGYICAGLAAVMPLIGLAGLILGILTANKRGRGGHGAAIIVLSIIVAGISFVVYYNHILHHAAVTSGSCYFDTAGNYTCP